MSPCKIEHDEDGQVTKMTCSRSERPRCYFCGKPSTKLCDYPTGTGTGTCDAQLCDWCSVKIGANTDYCPKHGKVPR